MLQKTNGGVVLRLDVYVQELNSQLVQLDEENLALEQQVGNETVEGVVNPLHDDIEDLDSKLSSLLERFYMVLDE